LTVHDVNLLKVGRHFRLSENSKLVIGRNEAENSRIDALVRDGDTVLQVADVPGPTALVRGSAGPRELETAAAIVARYTKARTLARVHVLSRRLGCSAGARLEVTPLAGARVAAHRIGMDLQRRSAGGSS
jgi:hypothetical protein